MACDGRVARSGARSELLKQARGVKRCIIADLHTATLDHLGLAATLKEYARRWSHTSEIRVNLQMTAKTAQLGKGASLALFRIAQESLTNVVGMRQRMAQCGGRLTIDPDRMARARWCARLPIERADP